MRSRRTRWVAWSLWGLAMSLEVAAILLWLPNHAALVDRFDSAQDAIPHVFLVPGYATVGAVIATRSRNRIGWLFLAFGLVAALLTFASPYYLRGVVIAPGSLPATAFATSLGGLLWPFNYLFLGLLLLLFPDGRLPSPRWRPAALVYVTSWGLLMLNGLVDPATHTIYGVSHTNPWPSRCWTSRPGRRSSRGSTRSPWPAWPSWRWRRWCAFADLEETSASSSSGSRSWSPGASPAC